MQKLPSCGNLGHNRLWNNLHTPWVKLQEATWEFRYTVTDINMRINTYFPCSHFPGNYDDKVPGSSSLCSSGGQPAEGGSRPSSSLPILLCPCPVTPSSKSPEALVLIMKCSAKSNVNKWHAQLTWQQSSPARNAAAFNSAGLGTNLQKKDQSTQETAKVKDRIFSRCLDKYTAQHPIKNSQTISCNMSENFHAVLGGMRRTPEHHTCLQISKSLTKESSILD